MSGSISTCEEREREKLSSVRSICEEEPPLPVCLVC